MACESLPLCLSKPVLLHLVWSGWQEERSKRKPSKRLPKSDEQPHPKPRGSEGGGFGVKVRKVGTREGFLKEAVWAEGGGVKFFIL